LHFRFASAKVETLFEYTKRLPKNFRSIRKIPFFAMLEVGRNKRIAIFAYQAII